MIQGSSPRPEDHDLPVDRTIAFDISWETGRIPERVTSRTECKALNLRIAMSGGSQQPGHPVQPLQP